MRKSSQEVVNKWGTFVEGIFDTTSYLPYLSNDPQSLFYQGLLFKSCLSYTINEDQVLEYNNDLCNVDTSDYKTYYVTLIPKNTWSDGVPVSLDDIFFTYKTILIDNAFELKKLEENTSITITKETNRLKITFPQANKDNTIFFTNYILPAHVLVEPNIDMYQQSFALEPVYNNCAKIQSQSTDQYSLIFDLTQCKDTNIGFYQVKNLQTFEDFEKIIKKDGKSIVDVYEGQLALTWYTKETLHTDRYMMLFFNTKSPKLLVRTRRALWGLLAHEIQKAKDIKFFDIYGGKIFNTYLSTGTNIGEFLTAAISNQTVNIKSIQDSEVHKLPKKISIKETNQAYSYYTSDPTKRTISFTLDQKYDKIAVQFNQEPLYYPKSYNKNKKTFDYIIAAENENLNEGLNSYTVYGFTKDKGKDKKIKLASIKVYLVQENTTSDDTISTTKIRVIYYKNPINQYSVDVIKKILAKNDISDFFVFDSFDEEDTMHGTLSNGEYDIFIGSINSSRKSTFYGFLNTDKALLNPSKYTNQKISSLLSQYNEHANTTVLKEINASYGNDMPFVILGKEQKMLAISPSIKEKLLVDTPLHEYNWRDMIYNNLVLTKNIYVDSENLFSFQNFYHYISK